MLGKYINSTYQSASNALRGSKAGRKVIAYVESYDDIFFWRSVLSLFETPDFSFSVMLPSRTGKLERGKKAALMSIFKDSVGPDLIACVDADYDWLKQGGNPMSELVCSSPYVFHTYAYAIENLQCWAPALHEVCVMATLNDSSDMFDFEKFFSAYSELIWPLFVWSVMCGRNAVYGNFQMPDLMAVIKTGAVLRSNADDTLKRVGEKVRMHLTRLKKTASPKTLQKFAEVEAELLQMGVLPSETYLYIQGHSLFKETVVPMLNTVSEWLIRQREGEIKKQSKHRTQQENEISCYKHSLESIPSMLKKHTFYLNSPQVARIKEDIARFIEEKNVEPK